MEGQTKHLDHQLLAEIHLVNDYRDTDALEKRVPESLVELTAHLQKSVIKKKKNAVADCLEAAQKYSNFPIFSNLLFSAYFGAKRYAPARTVAEQAFEKHPEYLFSRVNLCEMLFEDSELDRIPEVLHPSLHLRGLFPQRKKYTLNEVSAYSRLVVRYLLEMRDFERAKAYIESLRNQKLVFKETLEHLSKGVELHYQWEFARRQEEKEKNLVITKSKFKQLVPASHLPPELRHPEVAKLYDFEDTIDRDWLRSLLSLPRPTLIDDLVAVAADAIARYDFFWDNEELDSPFAPLHALVLLGELGAEEALPTVLDLMSQHSEFDDFWFGDTTFPLVSNTVARLLGGRLDMISDYFRRPDNDYLQRSAVAKGVVFWAMQHPERRAEAVEFFHREIRFLMENKDAEGVFDSDFLEFLLGDLVDLDARELLPLAQEVYEKNLISEGVYGDFEEYTKAFDDSLARETPWDSMFELYEMLEKWRQPKPSLPTILSSKTSLESKMEEYFSQNKAKKNTPPPKPQGIAPVGRNEPCPCGSGKKYKRCHGAEG